MKIRNLTKDEVKFTVSIEAEDIPVRGNTMCTDDPEKDKEYENEILDRLDRGYVEAWCIVVVKASWNGYYGTASVGGNSFFYPNDTQSDFEEVAEEYGLYEDALTDLNCKLECEASILSMLEIN